MRSVPLGASGVEITEFIFGAGGIGGIGSAESTRGLGLDAGQGRSRLSEAYELGIRVVDTADRYAGGESERVVGRWLATEKRDDVVVQTKVGLDLSAVNIGRQLARSIERLGRVDLYMSHAPDPSTPIEETLTAFAEAVHRGQIRAYGVSNVDARLLESLLAEADKRGLPRPVFVQNGFSLLDRSDERDLLPLITGAGMGYMAFSPLAGGVLSDRYLDRPAPPAGSRIALAGDLFYAGMHSPANLARVARLRDLARAHGVSTAGLALAWLRAHPVVTAPIVAPSTAAQWQAVRDALSRPLDDDLFAEIGSIFD
ncbi:aldo/keto reductase [Actinoplanes sp. NPDC051343]|uniref:aldo/keto reductase n=1 Tax=Actinoplanes sp. NPDC051343 TaxID=3363906 RepID=UPI00378AD1DB